MENMLNALEDMYIKRFWLVFVLAPIHFALVIATGYAADMTTGVVSALFVIAAMTEFFVGTTIVVLPALLANVTLKYHPELKDK